MSSLQPVDNQTTHMKFHAGGILAISYDGDVAGRLLGGYSTLLRDRRLVASTKKTRVCQSCDGAVRQLSAIGFDDARLKSCSKKGHQLRPGKNVGANDR